ncbi:hypothetical protein SELMODRAFT_406651 [Selaginella moellendorffii]|uniref:Uncharacterized protein n=1 Tax=Selaginella moellendorffii TaxID=88036 RepID=D8R112_SELML|nr:hypothetical protein SELMODRAFT_406651 [Selaginella moellendorffii]
MYAQAGRCEGRALELLERKELEPTFASVFMFFAAGSSGQTMGGGKEAHSRLSPGSQCVRGLCDHTASLGKSAWREMDPAQECGILERNAGCRCLHTESSWVPPSRVLINLESGYSAKIGIELHEQRCSRVRIWLCESLHSSDSLLMGQNAAKSHLVRLLESFSVPPVPRVVPELVANAVLEQVPEMVLDTVSKVEVPLVLAMEMVFALDGELVRGWRQRTPCADTGHRSLRSPWLWHQDAVEPKFLCITGILRRGYGAGSTGQCSIRATLSGCHNHPK